MAEAKVAYVGIEKRDEYYDSVGTFAVIEALAAGKATIVTYMKSMESYIEDGQNGVFVPHHDVQALQDALRHLLTDDRARQNLEGNARTWAEQHVDAKKFADKLAGYLERVCV